jgi:hypothetical protein
MARAEAWAAEMFIRAVIGPDFADTLAKRQAELLAGNMTADLLDEMRREIEDLEQVMPTRFAPPNAKERLAQLQREVREATARLMAQPDLQALVDLPKSEEQLRARWASWSIITRRAWLRRLVTRVEVKPATAKGRASVVEDRLDPVWKM